MEAWLDTHPALQDNTIKILSNSLALEFGACDRFKIDPYIEFTRPREWRQTLVGYHIGKSCIDTMRDYDKNPPKKPKGGKK